MRNLLPRLGGLYRSDKVRIGMVGVLVTVLCVLLHAAQPSWSRDLEHRVYDLLLRATHRPGTADTVAIVDVDEPSLKQFGQWPWPRSRLAILIEKLFLLEARAVGIDVLFGEPDRTSLITVRQELLRDTGIELSFDGVPAEALDNDHILAGTLQSTRTVLGFPFRSGGKEPIGEGCVLHPLQVALLTDPGLEGAQATGLHEATDVDCNLPLLSRAAAMSGFFTANTDADGILRRVPLVLRHGGKVYGSLALVTWMQARGIPQLALHLGSWGLESLRVADVDIPVDEAGRLMLNFRGGARSFRTIPAGDVLADRLPPGSLAGRIVFIGTSAAGLRDVKATPFAASFPGVEAHATVVDNIERQDFVTLPPWKAALESLLVLALGLLSALLLVRSRAAWSLAAIIACGLVLLGGTVWAMAAHRVFVSPLVPALVMALNFALLTLLRFYREEELQRFLKKTFSTYLSPELIESMTRSRKYPELGGEARELTAFFSDIQGFSTFSEALAARQLVELLNEYLGAMTEILLEEGGTLDKYEGDAIVAFFGAPAPLPDHAARAARAALRMQRRLEELSAQWSQERLRPDEQERNLKGLSPEAWRPGDRWPRCVHEMRMRIGLNSGEAVVGNMGSKLRMNYTMMGDSVNLASRLESAGKQYGVHILVSAAVLEMGAQDDQGRPCRVRDLLEFRSVDRIAVVGRSEATDVYEVFALRGESSEREKTLLTHYLPAYEAYQRGDWEVAEGLFAQAEPWERFPDAALNPSKVLRARCRSCLAEPPVPPGQRWDGVWRLRNK